MKKYILMLIILTLSVLTYAQDLISISAVSGNNPNVSNGKVIVPRDGTQITFEIQIVLSNAKDELASSDGFMDWNVFFKPDGTNDEIPLNTHSPTICCLLTGSENATFGNNFVDIYEGQMGGKESGEIIIKVKRQTIGAITYTSGNSISTELEEDNSGGGGNGGGNGQSCTGTLNLVPPINISLGIVNDVDVEVNWLEQATCETGHQIAYSYDGINFDPAAAVFVSDANNGRGVIQSPITGTPFYVRMRSYKENVGSSAWSSIVSIFIPCRESEIFPINGSSVSYTERNMNASTYIEINDALITAETKNIEYKAGNYIDINPDTEITAVQNYSFIAEISDICSQSVQGGGMASPFEEGILIINSDSSSTSEEIFSSSEILEEDNTNQVELYAPYPNPTSSIVNIPYSVEQEGLVRITIQDVQGRVVATLVSEANHEAGAFEAVWNTQGANTGVYICTLEANGLIQSHRIVVE